ncbi:MAG: phage terminase large subunit family protein, partial [Spirochaetaceae bacterium]
MADFAQLSEDFADCLGALDRPRRVPVSVGAAEALYLSDAGGYSGPWTAEPVPYLVKPMDSLASRHYEAVCFVGPARTGKTAGLILGWMAHALTNDIGRMMIMHMTEKKAALLSKLDVEPAIEASPKLRALKSPRGHDDTIHLKIFKHGMAIRFAHPSPSELAATTYRYVALTDYDRFTRNIGMGGEIFDTAHKRTETLMSRRMTLVESSPERQLTDPGWRPATPHEAPPTDGILGIYNRGDRHRWYWPCPECGEYFEAKPGLDLFVTLPAFTDLVDKIRTADITAMAEQHARVCCPHCGSQIGPEHKNAMNAAGVWLRDGEKIDSAGNITGNPTQSSIASFWMGGVAATYQTWRGILLKYLQGVRQFALTGSEEALEASTYTDQGMPYLPRHLVEAAGHTVESRTEPLERFHVPEWARFLLCAVDVQGGQKARFVVQVHAIGADMESAIIDRYDITESPRGADQRIDPAAYPEDWDVLTTRVINATYRVDGEVELRVLHTIVDFGGEAGVSPQAASWLRRCRTAGYSDRVTLGKGDTAIKDVVQRTFARDPRGKRMRDVPLLLFHSDRFKDMIAASLRRQEPGPTYMHFPQWLRSWFFDELRAEVRQPNGKWKKMRARNESLDLWNMIWALAYALGPADPRRPFPWTNPPPWAAPLDQNSHVLTR